MAALNIDEINSFIESEIKDYHTTILNRLLKLRLDLVLKRKNPYLFKVKDLNTSQDLVMSILNAHLSSQEETIFGTFLERLAIFTCDRTYGGKKSSTEGIDLEFERNQIRYLVSIKSGPNWGNSSQIAKMKDNFRKAKKILKINTLAIKIVFVNGCCYGKDDFPDKGDYLKLCGQRFWELLSGNENLYTEIIEPLGIKAKENTNDFNAQYSNILNRFTFEFSKEYCRASGEINWEKLIRFNSGGRDSNSHR